MPCCPETCAMPYRYEVCRCCRNKAAVIGPHTACESVQRLLALRERYKKVALIVSDLHHLRGLNLKPTERAVASPGVRGGLGSGRSWWRSWWPMAECSDLHGNFCLVAEHHRENACHFLHSAVFHSAGLCQRLDGPYSHGFCQQTSKGVGMDDVDRLAPK